MWNSPAFNVLLSNTFSIVGCENCHIAGEHFLEEIKRNRLHKSKNVKKGAVVKSYRQR